MDMFIYDEEGDRFVRVGWRNAIRAAGMHYLAANGNGFAGTVIGTATEIPDWTPGAYAPGGTSPGAGQAAPGGGGGLGAGTLAAWYGHADWLAYYSEVGVPTDATEYKTFFDHYKATLNLYLVVCRPFIEHQMHSAIAMVAGRDTGATLFGPAGECGRPSRLSRALTQRPPPVADMQISANTQVKTIEGHYVSGAAALHRRNHLTTPIIHPARMARAISRRAHLAPRNQPPCSLGPAQSSDVLTWPARQVALPIHCTRP